MYTSTKMPVPKNKHSNQHRETPTYIHTNTNANTTHTMHICLLALCSLGDEEATVCKWDPKLLHWNARALPAQRMDWQLYWHVLALILALVLELVHCTCVACTIDGLAVGENFPIICSHLSRLGHLRAYLSGLGQEWHIFQCLQHRLPPFCCTANMLRNIEMFQNILMILIIFYAYL